MKKILLGLTLSTLLTSCLFDTSKEVTYSVSGTAKTASITMAGSGGSTVQYSKVSLPWSTTISVNDGDFVYISAQNQEPSGSVTANIIIDGNLYKTATSSGAYVIATASGSAN